MKNPLFLSEEEEEGVEKWWWRAISEFDKDGNFKGEIANNNNPRIRVIREMERLCLIGGEGVDELRQKLMGYRAGDLWVPVGGINKQDMDIPDVITVLLVGLTGCGKSSLVNLMYSVLARSGLIPFAQTSAGESSNNTTMYLEEHNVLRSARSGLCVYDTRGLDPTRIGEGLADVATWMSGGVRHNEPCYRSPENGRGAMGMYVKRKVNCVMVVADLLKIHTAGDLKSLEALRDLFHLSTIKYSNENPILILTHGDTLNAEDRINARIKICEYLGIPETSGAYDIPCLTEQGILAEESDQVTAFALTEAVYRALLQADRSHIPKRKFKDHIILILLWIMWCIASFFAVIASFFAKFGHQKKKLKM